MTASTARPTAAPTALRPDAGSANTIYQVSTLKALAAGYTRKVITVGELIQHGDAGLGTFEDLGGEMIVVDGICYRAASDGSVTEAPADLGVPFAAVTPLQGDLTFELSDIADIDALKTQLDLKVEEGFGINSMHLIRIDGRFRSVHARSEDAHRSQHVDIKEILGKTQKDF